MTATRSLICSASAATALAQSECLTRNDGSEACVTNAYRKDSDRAGDAASCAARVCRASSSRAQSSGVGQWLITPRAIVEGQDGTIDRPLETRWHPELLRTTCRIMRAEISNNTPNTVAKKRGAEAPLNLSITELPDPKSVQSSWLSSPPAPHVGETHVIFQITPVPGICTSGASAKSMNLDAGSLLPKSRTAP
jgi:hypothetical protein